MKRMGFSVWFLALGLLMLLSESAFADWSLPISISSGGARTNLTVGIAVGATDGYDPGIDSPTPADGEYLNAYFPHPEWGALVVVGMPADKLHRDIRGAVPQDFYFVVASAFPNVVLNWQTAGMPEKTQFLLYDHTTDRWVNMREAVTYKVDSANNGFTIRVMWDDLVPPSAPIGLNLEVKPASLFIAWSPNPEEDLAGYKIHLGTKSRAYQRAIDLKDVNNYSFLNLTSGTYYIALTAYDKVGNESPYSSEVIAKIGQPPAALKLRFLSPSSGLNTKPVQVTIKGEGFISTPAVVLGNIELTDIRLVDVTTLKAVVPTGISPGTYDLVVTNPDGTTATLSKAYTARPKTPAVK